MSAPAIRNANGCAVWDFAADGIRAAETAPDSMHPALWRHARLKPNHGEFKVTDRRYQMRGVDLANMTIVAGETGVLVIDPLITQAASMDTLEAFPPTFPIVLPRTAK